MMRQMPTRREHRRPGMTIVPIGRMEGYSWLVPQAVADTSCRAAWDVTTEEVLNFETMPPLTGWG